jgi:pimeloyl-ACP methyl ester carboxylesterase
VKSRTAIPPIGEMLQVGDETVHVVIDGTGPAVLIDSGLGGSCLEWAKVAADLAADFTVVRYDRPGFAWSPPGRPHSPVVAAERIVALLRVLGLSAPWILVGHSMGGLTVRLVASLHPQQVAGLVLVDPSHEAMLEDEAALRSSKRFSAGVRMMVATTRFGTAGLLGRAYAKVVGSQVRQPLDDETRGLMRTAARLTLYNARGLRAVVAELAGLPSALEEVASVTAAHPLPDIPLTVITAAAPARTKAEEKARTTVNELHARQAAVLPKGRQVYATNSGHLVPLDEPNLIAQCVRETAKAGR